MRTVVQRHAPEADIVVMAAAVADYMPDRRAAGKIEKTDGPLELRAGEDAGYSCGARALRSGRSRPVLVGFAAESGDPVERGRRKLLARRVI